MSTIEEGCELNVPVQVAYNQWTQFEEFPQFMDGVNRVEQLDDAHLHWVVSHGGKEYEFDTEISEQRSDEPGAGKSAYDISHAGALRFNGRSGAAKSGEV